jgi:hypothetical protein
MKTERERNRLLVRCLLLPTIFLTVALLGGLRVAAETHAFLFIAPPLVALLLATLLMLLFARGRLINLHAWFSSDDAPGTVVSHALTLLTLFFASAQAFTSVLPERGLFRWMFAFFFLWTLWNNQFAHFDARRLLRSLSVLFGTAFVLKHMLLASLYASDGGWLKRLAGALLEGFTQGTLGQQETFAPSTGYISFFTLALYVFGLFLLPPAPDTYDAPTKRDAHELVTQYRQLSLEERALLREEILQTERDQLEDEIHATRTD